MQVTKTPPLGATGLAWLRGLIQREGVIRGGTSALRSLCELATDYLPARQRLRYGDIDYDFDHGVNTTWARPSLAVRLREVFTRGKYQPSEPELFHHILGAARIPYEEFIFIDLGSGKGRTLLMASDYPFRLIIGAEIIPELHETAQQNIQRYRSENQKCFALEAWLGDARQFPFPPEPMLVYLFNPFPEDILRTVLERIRESVEQQPREVCVIYHNLVHEGVFRSMHYLHPVHRTHQYAIYRTGTSVDR
jgi:hypothetical protein